MGKREKERKQLEKIFGHQATVILIAEDEPSVLEITVRALERKGYKTIKATNGAEAVAVYERNKDVIDVIILDMMMPVMDGDTAIKALRKINPKVKIVAISGSTEEAQFEESIMSVQAFLMKPYKIDALLATIREVLS